MSRSPTGKKLTALLLAVLLSLAGCNRRPELAPQESEINAPPIAENSIPAEEVLPPPDNSYEAITALISLPSWDGLQIARPEEDLETTASTYYITGVSDPAEELLLNDEPVEHRGARGSFGVFVDLKEGENSFTFTQGSQSESVTITRLDEEGYSLTEKATRMRPEYDAVAVSGESYSLSCIAPSGGKVRAVCGDYEIQLEQVAETAVEGVPATFSGAFTPGQTEGTTLLGPVTYYLEYGGKESEYPSGGRLFLTGDVSQLLVRGIDPGSAVFEEESDDGAFSTTLVENAVDTVTEIGANMYRLGMGGWVFKKAVEPLTEPVPYQNKSPSSTYLVEEDRETLLLDGVATPPYRAEYDNETGYTLTLFHTTGLEPIDTSGSSLVESIDIAEEEGNTVLTYHFRDPALLRGYLVECEGSTTQIILSAKPERSSPDLPLDGVTILVDPGHGGDDVGTLGLTNGIGPVEKEINLVTGLALRQYLEGMGATVWMTREEDVRNNLNDVLSFARDPEIDLSISLHCNSIGTSQDGTGPSGVEVYYYEDGSRPLAEALQSAIVSATGRKDRGAKHSYYKVTLNSGAPSVLVEMGFLSNPAEYDELCSEDAIYRLVEAVGKGVVDYFERKPLPPEEENDSEEAIVPPDSERDIGDAPVE